MTSSTGIAAINMLRGQGCPSKLPASAANSGGPHQDDAALEQMVLPYAAVDALQKGHRAQAADGFKGDIDHNVIDEAFQQLDLQKTGCSHALG